MIELKRRSDGELALADTEPAAEMLQLQGYDRIKGKAEVAPADKSADPPKK